MSNLSLEQAQIDADLEEDLEWEEYFDMEMPIETIITTSSGETAIILTEEHIDGDMDAPGGRGEVEYETSVTNALGESFQDWDTITSYSRENAISAHLKMVAAWKRK